MKRTAVLLLSIILCVIFAACGSPNSENTVEDNSSGNSNSANQVDNSANHTADAKDSTKDEDSDVHFTTLNFGDTISTDFVEMTIQKAETAQELYPTDTSGSYNYKPDQDGETYFYVLGTIKNTSGDSYDVEDMRIVMTFDGKYNYSGYIAADDGGNDFYGSYVKPFGSVKYYMYASIPDELISTYSTCVVKFAFHENFEHDRKSDFSVYEHCYEINLTR